MARVLVITVSPYWWSVMGIENSFWSLCFVYDYYHPYILLIYIYILFLLSVLLLLSSINIIIIYYYLLLSIIIYYYLLLSIIIYYYLLLSIIILTMFIIYHYSIYSLLLLSTIDGSWWIGYPQIPASLFRRIRGSSEASRPGIVEEPHGTNYSIY